MLKVTVHQKQHIIKGRAALAKAKNSLVIEKQPLPGVNQCCRISPPLFWQAIDCPRSKNQQALQKRHGIQHSACPPTGFVLCQTAMLLAEGFLEEQCFAVISFSSSRRQRFVQINARWTAEQEKGGGAELRGVPLTVFMVF